VYRRVPQVGLLMSQWTIMGYDACVNMAEETVDADYAGSNPAPSAAKIPARATLHVPVRQPVSGQSRGPAHPITVITMSKHRPRGQLLARALQQTLLSILTHGPAVQCCDELCVPLFPSCAQLPGPS
jgi:hypothetical protein